MAVLLLNDDVYNYHISKFKNMNETLKKQHNADLTYMSMAFLKATLSKAQRAKVGAIVVKEGIVVSTGFNGTPRGVDNCCESQVDGKISTKDEVIHAELNAILNMVISGNGVELNGTTIYVTFMPCIRCSALIKQVGIKRVVYCKPYRLTDGIEFLKANGVQVDEIKEVEVYNMLSKMVQNTVGDDYIDLNIHE